MGTMIGDDFVIESKSEVYFVEKEGGYPFCSDGFLSGAENYPLCKAMVDHDQQRIEARGSRKVSDKVTGDLLEWARGMRFDWGEWGNSGVHVRFVLLACGTSFNIFVHELSKAWPPELGSNKLPSFEIYRVTSSFMVMTAGKDGVIEGILWEDIDTTFVCEDMVVKLPVREAGPEGGGDIF